MIQFSKLRLHGFKSFVEKTEVEIGPGLTGIVGPNGCGKSNLVEALRWSMGESSTKRMRGGSRSMEDVIFAGTARRPARHMAEVSVLLDNSLRTAPAPYNNSDEIEVVRRIEKDRGSDYRINGKLVRARDVQLLYADILSGANSPYLVSQGRVTAIIQAKPAERRLILEEAAGITGLYARRHEAELRLRATDANLKRVEDLLGGMEERLNGLKKQARQAARYRNLSAKIRQLEIAVSCLEWRDAHERLRDVETGFGTQESRVAEHMLAVNQLTRTQTDQSADLPGLREQDAALGATLQAHNLALQRLEDEQGRIAQELEDAASRLGQIGADRTHEQQTLKENSATLERLEQEEKNLRERETEQDGDLDAREETRRALKAAVDEKEGELTALMEDAASLRARRESLERQIEQDRRRCSALRDRLADVKAQLAAKKEEEARAVDIAALREKLAAADKTAEDSKAALAALGDTVQELAGRQEEAQTALREREKEKSRIESEAAALESVLHSDSRHDFRPVFEDVAADPGFETALSRALGDTLMASLDESAPAVWEARACDPAALPPLPEGAQALEPHVRAPAVLKCALSQIGIAQDADHARKLAPSLKPGQSLVTRDGACWRWDGLHIKTTAADDHARQLRQKNKLAELKSLLPACEQACADLQAALEDAASRRDAARKDEDSSRAALAAQETALRDIQKSLNHAIEQQAGHQAELAKLEEILSMADSDLQELESGIRVNEKTLESCDPAILEEKQERSDAARALLSAEREKLQNAVRDLEMAKQEQSRRKARLRAIGDERINLQNRCIRAREHLKELEERETALSARRTELQSRPAAIGAECEGLLEKIGVLEKEKSGISDRLAACEAELAETAKALKQAESQLSEAREARARSQAMIEERRARLDEKNRHIEETFEMTPARLMAEAAMDPDNLPDLAALREEREQTVRSRDLIGPVNLRAEQEAEELEKELGGILSEKNDLSEAVDELRQGIQKLNREARERLQAAFTVVNEHFREKFTQLFNGGKAHLALIESDDPLEAGLEIYAQPPGKALQSLSLLSGGEQTMTALALIFAMFLTNPAPICVMDEVDAPLDDANVDRFCDLLEEFAEKGRTRFLIITHHRLTMARMDRLYGVTMAEKGVSQLVSVDLNRQLDFLDAAE